MSMPRESSSFANKLQAEVKEILVLAAQGTVSLAWLWPLRGVIFAITHPNVILSVRGALLKSLLSSALIFGVLSFFTYLPQAAFLAALSGPLAPFLALLLVGAESIFLLSFLARPLFLEPALTHVFDATLLVRGQGQLVKDGKTRTKGGSTVASAESALVKPLQAFSKDGILRYLVTLPLNLVPVAGTTLFVLYNGYRGGPAWHARYFQLKGMSKNQRTVFVDRRRAQYAAFGTATLLFNFVPLVGLVFSFTNTIAAAMWAAQLEAQSNLIDSPMQSQTTKTKDVVPVKTLDVTKTFDTAKTPDTEKRAETAKSK
ncbi:hypothetical protein AcV7_003149 [Taiwanofungus camphoratus]|nr:hypothetical protein AcV7_003149 [Antrodia cinnamomea]